MLQVPSSAKSSLVDELHGMLNLVLHEILKFCEHALFPSRQVILSSAGLAQQQEICSAGKPWL